MKPGQEARVDYEYIRNGVVNIFMANEPLKGKRFVEVTEFKTRKDWVLTEHRLYMKHSDQKKQKGYGTGLNLYIHRNMAVGSIWRR